MTPAAHVLVIDDEPHIRLLIRRALTRDGYEVSEAGAGRGALAAMTETKPEVVLLDLGLPDRDGLELIPMLKQSGATVLIISAREATEEKVAALDMGADDYITKPFDTDELLARVRTALRHRATSRGEQAAVVAGDVVVDLVRRRVTKGAAEVHLTPKEYEVVAALAKFPGRVITHAHLLKAVWTHEQDGHVEYLRVLVRGIRQKLETDPSKPSVIVNELGIGYRLMAPDI